MPLVWLRPEAGRAWAYFLSVTDTTAHLKVQGIELFATQASCAAKNAKTHNGWQLCSTSPDADVLRHVMRISRHLALPRTTWDRIPDNAKVVC